jgi:LmbE family N-acetylglucosaminyl deacetylase
VRNAARDLRRFHNLLVVFPHADDETITCGGTISRFADAGARVTLVILTGGERGTPTGALDLNLKAVRRAEAEQAARILGIARVLQEDFGDGELAQRTAQVMPFLAATIAQVDPDLLLTHDLSGVYGHSDHVACAEMITELRRTQFPQVRLWYGALPPWGLPVLRLIGQIPRDPSIDARRAPPTHRLFVGPALTSKIGAWNAHRSQQAAIPKGFIRLLPSWLAASVWPFEYFAEVA